MSADEAEVLLTAVSVGFWQGVFALLAVALSARAVVSIVIDVREHIAYRRALASVERTEVDQ